MNKELRARAMNLEFVERPNLDEAARVEMTVRCRDGDSIPKVPDAGRVLIANGTPIQIMHNGLRVVADAYYGSFTREIIERCRGHFEPQEEVVFHELLRHISPDATMLEVGGFWAYYTLWFLKDSPRRRAIVIEPDPSHLEIGRQNAALNNGSIEFIQGFVGGEGPEIAPFETETSGVVELPRIQVPALLEQRNLEFLDILHCDAQGAEFDVLISCADLIAAKRIHFIVISTHLFSDPLRHQRCLWLVRELGGEVLAEHDIHESFSADGLIVAYFGDKKIDWKHPRLSYNRYSTSFQRNPLFDLSCARKKLATLSAKLEASRTERAKFSSDLQTVRRKLRSCRKDRTDLREINMELSSQLKSWRNQPLRTLVRSLTSNLGRLSQRRKHKLEDSRPG